jgi:Protein of unknown function (DUF1822)
VLLAIINFAVKNILMVYNPERSEPTEMYLEISEDLQTLAWQHAQLNFTKTNQWRGYLNHLCWQLSRTWFATATDDLIVGTRENLSEFLNGTAIAIGEQRLCLIPQETYDRSELRIPCEWIEIPDWIADYYLAVQIDAEAGTATIWGYATHQQVQQQGIYDELDRTYCLDADDLMQDLSLLPVALEKVPPSFTKGAIGELKNVPSRELGRYLDLFSLGTSTSPRVDISEDSFPFWLVVMANQQWRREIYQRRLGKELVGVVEVT